MQRVALIQLNVSPDPAENLQKTLTYLENAADQGAEFILTPECSNFLCAEGRDPKSIAILQNQEPLLAETQKFCARRNVWVCLGSLILAQDKSEKLLNRQFLISPDGKIKTTYDKIHLFDVNLDVAEQYQESRTYNRGTQAKISHIGPVSLGHSICYDVRFPHLYRSLKAHILLVPAAFTHTTGKAHWDVLLRARAIENGAFVLAAAQTGIHDENRQTFGHSLIVDPWGKVLADMGLKSGVLVLDIDLTEVSRRRSQIPAMTADQSFGLEF